MRLFKKFLLFTSELVFLFFGFIFAAVLAAYLNSLGSRFALLALVLGFTLICAAVVWFRCKTEKWSIAADAKAWLGYRSWRKLHPRCAKYLRILQTISLLLPAACSMLVLFFLPVASHIVYSGTGVPHYRVAAPLNWLIIKSSDGIFLVAFFSNHGAAQCGLTPIWFNHRMPSNSVFYTSDPKHADEWWRPNHELATGHTTHVGVRRVQVGVLTATCYEYKHIYSDGADHPSSTLYPSVYWESLCSTQPNGIQYNLRAAFFGDREDLPAFYEVLNSATPTD